MNTQFSEFVRLHGGAKTIARQLGVSSESVQKWARGERRPRPDQALAIERLSNGELPKERWYWNDAA